MKETLSIVNDFPTITMTFIIYMKISNKLIKMIFPNLFIIVIEEQE